MRLGLPDIKAHVRASETALKYLTAKPRITVPYPEALLELPQGYRGMVKLNVETCISCTQCARICPSNAIKMHKRERKRLPGINYQRCIFCGFCVDICPVIALEFTDVHDLAFHTLPEHLFEPEGFAKGPPPPHVARGTRKVRTEIDEVRGFKYE